MKIFTKNLIYFALTFLAGAIAFRFGLSYILKNQSKDFVWAISIAYFFFNFGFGWFFGRRDNASLPLFDIGFRFHFTSYLVFISVSLGWFGAELNAPIERIESVYYTALYWGIGLFAHFISFLLVRKNSIKGLRKEEIFE